MTGRDKREFISEFISGSREETIAYGEHFSADLKENDIVCFLGDLGAGKTTFIKGLVKGFLRGLSTGLSNGLLDHKEEAVTSPTFVYLNIYRGKESKKIVYHFDLYRLKDSNQFLSMGFDEMFDSGGICLIEWSLRINDILPKNCLFVEIEHMDESKRKITFYRFKK